MDTDVTFSFASKLYSCNLTERKTCWCYFLLKANDYHDINPCSNGLIFDNNPCSTNSWFSIFRAEIGLICIKAKLSLAGSLNSWLENIP